MPRVHSGVALASPRMFYVVDTPETPAKSTVVAVNYRFCKVSVGTRRSTGCAESARHLASEIDIFSIDLYHFGLPFREIPAERDRWQRDRRWHEIDRCQGKRPAVAHH